MISPIQTEKTFKKWDYVAFAILTLISVAATIHFLAYWLSFKTWLHNPIRFAISISIFVVVVANYFGRWSLLLYMRRPKSLAAKTGWRVAVVTTVIPRAEPIEMLEQTLSAILRLDYPHDTWVLDEDDCDEVRRLCSKLGVQHFSRKGLPHYQTETGTYQSGSKHGNYNAWLNEIGFQKYDIITAFDPDHMPQSHFLTRVLGYFDNAEVAYVQAAQAYYNQNASFIARGAAEETYAYYSSVQMAGYGLGYPIIIGCHSTHRVKALKQIGGFAAHDAEDLLMTLVYRANGWQGVYVPEILARGLTPVDWDGYLCQQRRWARSVLDIKLRIYHTVSDNLSLKPRLMSTLHGFNYLYKSFVILLGLLLTLYALATGHVPIVMSLDAVPNLIGFYLILLICDSYRQRFYLDPRNECGLHWRVALLQMAKWPYTMMAFCEVVLNRRVPYVLTPKVRSKPRYLLLWPHLTVVFLVLCSWMIGVASGNINDPSMHVWAGTIVAGLLAIAVSALMPRPAPYDRKLAPFSYNSEATRNLDSAKAASAGSHLGD